MFYKEEQYKSGGWLIFSSDVISCTPTAIWQHYTYKKSKVHESQINVVYG